MSNGKNNKPHGGPRPNSGRPRKVNPQDFVQVTCVLRRDTVEKLRAGAGGKHKFFGAFLQFHLDRFPIPTHEEYLAMREGKPLMKASPGRRKIPVIFAGNVARARRPRPLVPRRHTSEADQIRQRFLKRFEPV